MPLQKGDIIGGYEIVSPLGQGGMATVFKAFHPRLNRFVAIKMIHQAYLQDPTYLARFEREAQIVAGLEHPNIVPVYDFSDHHGEPYLVMKLIEGYTLKQLLGDGALPVDDILAVATPIASALDYAHGKGVLHRDIKPSNIILDNKAWPYLSDFGLARLSVSGASTLSQDLMIGTPYYMSPEQATGKGEIDHRADLYSFGVVLYELFVGQVPFSEGTPYAIINDHIARELPLPSKMNPDVPPRIEAVLLKALTKDREDRYQSGAEMIEAVRSAANNEAAQVSILSLGRQSAIQSLGQLKTETPAPTAPPPAVAAPAVPVSAVSRSAAPPAAETRKGKKTAAMPQTSAKQPPKKKQSYTVELVLLATVLGLVIIFVVFAVSRQPSNTLRPTAAVVQQPTLVIVTLPKVPTDLPASASSTRPPNQPTTSSQNSQNSAALPLPPTMPIPAGMSAQQARDMISHDATNMGAYVALYQSQLQSNDTAGAIRTYAQGLSHTKDSRERLAYELTSAGIAVDAGQYDIAFEVYSAALESAQDQPPYQAVRAAAGEFMYQAATLANRLTLVEVTALRQQLANNSSPVVAAMIGRAFLSNDNPRLAETSINAALSVDSNLAEAHLVNGEYALAQGDKQKAQSEWQLALNASDAPQWVHDRASQLINSNQ